MDLTDEQRVMIEAAQRLLPNGFVIVPKVATPEMQNAGGFYHIQGGGAVTDADLSLAKQSWHAMVEAWRRDNG